jgi:uncharacterized protein
LDRVLISGASGLIGRAVAPTLELTGAEIIRLVRRPARSSAEIEWNPSQDLPSAVVSGFAAVVHLAGENIFGRWTDAKKNAIRVSRTEATKSLTTAIANAEVKPRVFVCASAIGFYGDRGDEVLTEATPNGTGFLAGLSRDWEEASRSASNVGIRTVNLRTGLVLSEKGGALAKMLLPFRFGLGGKLGSGKQWWSWIHLEDIVGAILHTMENESISGPVNLVAPNPVRNEQFTKLLASVLGRPAILPLPAVVARVAFGEMAEELMLSSQRVLPRKLETSGYVFRFSDLRPALESLV